MEVYLEVAFLENFLLDGVLLYLALVCARVKPSVPRLLTASALGAVEAIVFPPCRLPGAAAYFVKIAGGLLLIAVAVPGKRFRPYWMTAAAFFLLTFALGGLLTAAYSFFGISYAETGGYLVEQAPVGLIVGATVAFFAAVCSGARAMYRYRRTEKNVLPCKLKAGTREVAWRGYADTGNHLFFNGEPVCVISAAAVFALYGRDLHEVGRISVGTVNGRREAPVFSCDSLSISAPERTIERENVYLTVGEVGKNYQLILNTALMEA